MITSKKIKVLLGTLFLSLMLILGGQILNEHSHVHAQSTGDCAEQGFKNWDGWFWNSSGVDCWCNERENVTTPCSTNPVEG